MAISLSPYLGACLNPGSQCLTQWEENKQHRRITNYSLQTQITVVFMDVWWNTNVFHLESSNWNNHFKVDVYSRVRGLPSSQKEQKSDISLQPMPLLVASPSPPKFLLFCQPPNCWTSWFRRFAEPNFPGCLVWTLNHPDYISWGSWFHGFWNNRYTTE